MRVRILLAAFLLTTVMMMNLVAQKLPLVYTVENAGKDYPRPQLLTIDQLPSISAFPDPFSWADGRGRITSTNDWMGRRAEIKAQIENYEIGVKPTRPDTIQASYAGNVLTVKVTVNGKILTLTSQIILPSGTGPFPAVIGMNSPSGSVPSTVFSSRNIAQITFNYNQLTTDGSASNSNPYYQLYPYLNIDNTGQYSAWAWGVSRIIDGLELVQGVLPIDIKHIAVSGCSRGGKMALFAGAFDERIALTISQESGGGGATSWRYSHSEPSGSVELIDNTDYNWFMNSMKQFSGDNVSKLPEDHHELMGMVAPRALLVTANPDMIWLSNPSSYAVSKACQQIYNTLGIPDRFGFSIIGGHGHCAVPANQILEIGAFVDKFMLGKDTTNTNITTTPYTTNLSAWITWTNPVLSSTPSFSVWPSLVYPANVQKGLDKNITLKWSKVKDAAKYFIQVASDPLFSNLIVNDSTTTDTIKAVAGLADGKAFYWHVRVKNSSGYSGPFSNAWNFATYAPLPNVPQLVAAVPVPTRATYITLKWKKVQDANQYFIQISDQQKFSTVLFRDSTTTDTAKTFSGLREVQKYYWRVQASNVSGSSAWSNVLNFTTILPPTNLVLKRSGEKEITLTWDDNSKNKDGYVIERKMSPQTTFTMLDTLRGDGYQYIDKKVEPAQTYTYRTYAYTAIPVAQSDYSNEASLLVVDVKNEGIPTEYSISQNYPNPFNPATKLKFALPQRSFTKLIIYDLLGKEVQTLINKELEAGYHEINFNASSFPSGIYFYRIQSGNFIQTKKMILMK